MSLGFSLLNWCYSLKWCHYRTTPSVPIRAYSYLGFVSSYFFQPLIVATEEFISVKVLLKLQTAPQSGTGSGFLPCPTHVPHAENIIYISINRANCLEL